MKNHRTLALLISLGAGAAPLGCSDGTVNIGETRVAGAEISDYAATWDGYAQAFTFSDGSDHVHLTIDAAGQGTLLVGDSAPPPAPTDPDVGYPPGYQGMFSTSGGAGPPIPGFPYPLHDAEVQSARIRVGIDYLDFYSAWCALQTSFPHSSDINGPAAYGCLPEVKQIDHASPDATSCNVTFVDGTQEFMDCGKVSLCVLEMLCTCTADGCSTAPMPSGTPATQYPAMIDGALDATGSMLTGTMLPGRATVLLQKQ